MSILKTDYKDDVINEELASDRKFGEQANEDGTKTFNDLTPYTQEGDEYGAKQINAQNKHCNYAIEAADHTYEGVDLTVEFAEEIAGYANVWRWIKARCAAANFDGLHVGDYIPITMNSNPVVMQIAGIDTYYRCTDQEQGHHIDWISKDLYPGTTQWFTSNDNNGTSTDPIPYNKSILKTFLSTLQGYLPSELAAVISAKRFLIETRYSASGKLTESNSWTWAELGKLWVPSEYEVFGSQVWSSKPYGAGHAVQYPIFANSFLNRIKGNGAGGSRASWWLLSVCGGGSTRACGVSYGGYADNNSCAASLGVPVCFRISE